MRYSASIVMLLLEKSPLVPAAVRAINEAPGVNVSVLGPSIPSAPINSSSAWAVDAVVPDEGLELEPVAVLVRSSVPAASSPANSFAVNARAVTDGWVTVMVEPAGTAVTL
jgi:hypothetical protein